jgi:predicted nucleic acid-binding Zn ribbon protein
MAYKYRDNRKNTTQSLQDILKEIIGRPSISKGLYPSRIPRAWNEVMGPSVARVTKNVWFRGGIVYVTLHSSIIRSELMMYRNQIVKNLNDNIGQPLVKDIVLR